MECKLCKREIRNQCQHARCVKAKARGFCGPMCENEWDMTVTYKLRTGTDA